jgi:hypothetical protein
MKAVWFWLLCWLGWPLYKMGFPALYGWASGRYVIFLLSDYVPKMHEIKRDNA